MKKLFLFIFLFITCCTSFAQNPKIDSLLTVLKTEKEDTNKVKHLNNLVNQYISSEPKQALEYALQALKLAKSITWQKGIANSYHSMGYYYYAQGDYPHTLDYWLKALKVDEELNNKKGIADRLGNIGLVYYNQADYPKALDYFLKALKLAEELGYKNGVANTLGNIAGVYYNQADYPKVENIANDLKVDALIIYYFIADYFSFSGNSAEAIKYANLIIHKAKYIKENLNELTNPVIRTVEQLEQNGKLILGKHLKSNTINRTPMLNSYKMNRNDIITVQYQDGRIASGKYKKFILEIERGLCNII